MREALEEILELSRGKGNKVKKIVVE